ncbi:unnamed protein product, partial [Pylaiella littoralis]
RRASLRWLHSKNGTIAAFVGHFRLCGIDVLNCAQFVTSTIVFFCLCFSLVSAIVQVFLRPGTYQSQREQHYARERPCHGVTARWELTLNHDPYNKKRVSCAVVHVHQFRRHSQANHHD